MGLTLVSGDAAASSLLVATARVREVVSYLRSEVGMRPVAVAGSSPTEDTWMRSSDLLNDPMWLSAIITASGERLGTDNKVVATSLFVQNYAYRVMTLAVASTAFGGVVPDSRHERLGVTMKSGRPYSIAYLDPRALVIDEPPAVFLADPVVRARVIDELVDGVIEGHLAGLIESARESVRIGERLLWGNVVASCAVAFRTVEGLLGPLMRDFGEHFMQRVPPQMTGLGSFLLLERGERHGWFWERTNCCLYDRLADVRCADCSKTSPEECRLAYLRSLDAPT